MIRIPAVRAAHTESITAALAEWGVNRHRLLVVEQFEELFTLCRNDDEREAFLAALEHLAIRGEHEPAAVVIEVRADFYGEYLAAAGGGGLRLWDLDPRQAIDRICVAVQPMLSREVWQEHLAGLPYRKTCG
ncbi:MULTISPECIES: hypothetical protein [unclassified Nocardia]|uniref:nSTAND1 domain-containing NTPase n=1 Tax=unclassified Nocardia TaxID=2637762 RepID=UPI003438FEE4